MGVSRRRRHDSLVWISLVALLVGGCHSVTAPSPGWDVAASEGQTWALVPVLASGPRDADEGVTSLHAEFTAAIQHVLDAEGQQTTLFPSKASPDTAAFPPSRLYVAPGDRSKRTVDPRALQQIVQSTGARYLLVVQAATWDRSLLAANLRRPPSATVTSALLSGLLDAPTNGQVARLAVIDARRGREVWAARRDFTGTSRPWSRDAPALDRVAKALVLEMTTGRALPPRSFAFETDGAVLVYRFDAPSVRGMSARVDGFSLVVTRSDGSTVRYSLHTVSSVRSTDQNRTIFPVH